MKDFSILAVALLLLALGSVAVTAQEPLDDDLLKELDDDLLEGLDALPELDLDLDLGSTGTDSPNIPDAAETTKPAAGEITVRSENPLLRLSEKMSQSKSRIENNQLAGDTQKLQTEIVSDLDVLIELVSQQCEQCKSGGQKPNGSASKPQEKPGSPKKGEGGTAESQATNPKESTNRVGSAGDTEVKRRQVDSMLGEIWGQLPDRVRMRMQDAAVEQVLPKYEKLIEEYYKRLAEERRLRP